MAAKDEETKETEEQKDQESQEEDHKSADSSEDLDQEALGSDTENDTDEQQFAEERKSTQENPEMGENVLKGKIVQIMASPRRQQDYVVTLKITQQKLPDIRVLNRLQKFFLKQMQALEEGTED